MNASKESLCLQALLEEYSSLRQEASQLETNMLTLATTALSLLAAIITAAASIRIIDVPEEFIAFFYYSMLPCICMFFGVSWVNLLYRRSRFGQYLKNQENKINYLLEADMIEWEHWISYLDITSKNSLTGYIHNFLRANYIYGYLICGGWILLPIILPLSSTFTLINFTLNVFKYFSSQKILGIIMIILYIIYYIFILKLIFRCAKLPIHEVNIDSKIANSIKTK